MAVKQKILIVDDDNNIAELISLYLTKECYDTKIVNDGEQALITYDGENAGLVLQAPDGTKTVVEDDTVKQGINPNTAVFQGDKLDFVSNGDTVDFVQVSLTDGSVTTAALPQDLAYSLNSLTTVGNQLVYLSFDNNTGDIILNALDPATGASTELLNPVPNATSSQAVSYTHLTLPTILRV